MLMAAAFSSLRDLFTGDEDCAPVFRPGLVALICDALNPPPQTSLTVAERIFPELEDVGPRTHVKYDEVVGADAMAAIREGFELWKRHEHE